MHKALVSIENDLPFPILGFDSDNGTELLNWHLYRHFTNRKAPVQFTQSRTYKKNDNAHIEVKIGVSFDSISDITVLNRWN